MCVQTNIIPSTDTTYLTHIELVEMKTFNIEYTSVEGCSGRGEESRHTATALPLSASFTKARRQTDGGLSTLSLMVCLIDSLSSSCFLYLARLSISACLMASCLSRSCSSCSSLVSPESSSPPPPTPGMLSANVLWDKVKICAHYALHSAAAAAYHNYSRGSSRAFAGRRKESGA